MKKIKVLNYSLLATLTVMLMAGAFIGISNAATNNESEKPKMEKRFVDQSLTDEDREARQLEMNQRKEKTEAAIKANDYQAWVSAVGENCPMLEKINQDNFAKFVEANLKIQEGQAILAELGVNQGPGMGGRGMHGNWNK
jgi:hypothetical protein